MVSKLSEEPRKIGEFAFIAVIATLILVLGTVATRAFPGRSDDETSGVYGASQPSVISMDPSPTSANPSPTAEARERPTYDPEVTPDTWVPAEQFPGVEAIHPSLDTAPPGEPLITVSDVEAYVASGAGDVAVTDEIVSIEFLPAHVVEERIGAAPGAYAGRLLCVVDLRGSYNIGFPPEVQEKIREEDPTFEITRMIAIFDARTGNLLSQTLPPP
jgi:hypothetical protein